MFKGDILCLKGMFIVKFLSLKIDLFIYHHYAQIFFFK